MPSLFPRKSSPIGRANYEFPQTPILSLDEEKRGIAFLKEGKGGDLKMHHWLTSTSSNRGLSTWQAANHSALTVAPSILGGRGGVEGFASSMMVPAAGKVVPAWPYTTDCLPKPKRGRPRKHNKLSPKKMLRKKGGKYLPAKSFSNFNTVWNTSSPDKFTMIDNDPILPNFEVTSPLFLNDKFYTGEFTLYPEFYNDENSSPNLLAFGRIPSDFDIAKVKVEPVESNEDSFLFSDEKEQIFPQLDLSPIKKGPSVASSMYMFDEESCPSLNLTRIKEEIHSDAEDMDFDSSQFLVDTSSKVKEKEEMPNLLEDYSSQYVSSPGHLDERTRMDNDINSIEEELLSISDKDVTPTKCDDTNASGLDHQKSDSNMLHQRESTTLFAQVPCDLEDLLLSDITDPFLFETDQADSPDLDKVFDDALFLDLLTPPYSPVDVFKEISEAAYVDQILVEHDYSKPWQEETTTTTVIEVPVDDGIVLDESPVYSPVPRPASSSSSSDSTQETSDSDVDVVTVTSDPEFSEFEPVKARKPRRKYIRKDYLPSTGAITKKPLTGRRRGRKPAYIVHSENSSPYESEQDKKETHNQLERKRRNDLSRAYQDVRLLIPSLQDNPRASKVKILESAASLVHSFSQQNLEEVLRKEKKEVDRLMREINRIQSLQ